MMNLKNQAQTINSNRTHEFFLLGVIILAGITLRVWRLSELGLVHFDEGVYAISGLWTTTPINELQLYTKQILFSPPLFFSLVGFSYWILGEASDKAAVLVNVVTGVATIGILWWFTRRWFGREAGTAAAVIVALSNFHIAYSRMVLTDIAFGFFFLLSLALIAEAMERVSLRWSIVSGIVIGVAWNTKYHGWLLLIVALMVMMIITVIDRNKRIFWKRLLMCWIVMSGVAVVCYLPWAMYIQSHPGGYLSLMKYQRTFLDPHWLNNLWRQTQSQLYMDGWLSRLSPSIAFLLALAVRDKQKRPGLNMVLPLVIILLCSGLLFSGVGTAMCLSVLAILLLIKRSSYGCWLILVSLGLFFLLTPLYDPYPRLLMPWLLVLYICSGVGIERTLTYSRKDMTECEAPVKRRLTLALLIAVSVILGLLVTLIDFRSTPRTWMATDSVRNTATKIVDKVPRNSVIFVHGAPEVAFYLDNLGLRTIPIDYPIDHPEVTSRYTMRDEELYLITGIYGERKDPLSRASLKRLLREGCIHPIGNFAIKPNDVRLLNDFSPKKAYQYRLKPWPCYDLHLYKVRRLPKEQENT